MKEFWAHNDLSSLAVTFDRGHRRWARSRLGVFLKTLCHAPSIGSFGPFGPSYLLHEIKDAVNPSCGVSWTPVS